MFSRAVRLTRLHGIDVRLDPSLALFALLVAWFFGARFRLTFSLPVAIAMALVGAVLFFASILAHEIAHALEARHRELEVRSITLFLFGGVTEMHGASETPRDEFAVAAVGPYVSLVCGAGFGLLATFAPLLLPAPVADPVAAVAGLLAWINVILAVFNLVPGAPLDGGRVLRAGLWWLLKDRRRALRISARAGQGLAIILVLLGIRGLVGGAAEAFGGFWWVIIGFFLWSAARTELRQSDLDTVLEGRRARDLIAELPEPVEADRPLELLHTGRAGRGRELLPVAEDGAFLGVLQLDEVERLHPADRSLRTAGDLARGVDELPHVDLDADVQELLTAFAGDSDVVVLCRDGQPVGVVTEREVARSLRGLRTSGGRSPRRRPRRHLPSSEGHEGPEGAEGAGRRGRGRRRRP